MPNLKEVRTRIASIKSTQQITAAMKLVAASRLRKTQNAILKLRPYAEKLKEISANLSSSEQEGNSLAIVRPAEKILIVALSSNRGLCGAFNTNVIRRVRQLIEGEFAEQHARGDLKLITIGRKISEHYIKRQYPVLERHDDVYHNLSFEQAAPLAEKLMEQFNRQEYDRIVLVYNQFKNAAVQKTVDEVYLPVASEKEESDTAIEDFILEPDKETILQELIPKILKIQFYKALLDSFASEHGARMTAMHQATENAKDILRELNLSYNKARQATITKEILEIVSGANALREGQ
jgi:F-type H+-transporting ATPase subunit gamma